MPQKTSGYPRQSAAKLKARHSCRASSMLEMTRTLGRFLVDGAFGNFCQGGVSLLFFRKSLIKQPQWERRVSQMFPKYDETKAFLTYFQARTNRAACCRPFIESNRSGWFTAAAAVSLIVVAFPGMLTTLIALITPLDNPASRACADQPRGSDRRHLATWW